MESAWKEEVFRRADMCGVEFPGTRRGSQSKISSKSKGKWKQGEREIVQITVFPGVAAYRLGGWEANESTCERKVYQQVGYEEQGFRRRLLMKGVVFCRRGLARAFDGEGDDGFREFRDVKGLKDWAVIERKGREEEGREQ